MLENDEIGPQNRSFNDETACDKEASQNGNDTSENESSFSADLEDKATKVLSAVNKILDSNDKIRSVCNKYKRRALIEVDEDCETEKDLFMEAGKRIITHYSDRAGITGGVTGLPSMIPGIGSVISLVGSSAVDIVLMLKFEIEMSLCLCHLTGLNIDEDRNRQLAYYLATASSREILSQNNNSQSHNIIKSAAVDYSVRELSKLVIKNITAILLVNLSRGMMKAVPFLGIAVGASVNKVMTKRSGLVCLDAWWLRRHLPIENASDNSDDIVYDAEILD